jgi:RimJ/RimL family protein N-acetyltransferase/anti-anti-sigma regulatory factor
MRSDTPGQKAAVIPISGELTLASAAAFSRCVQSQLAADVIDLTIDLEAVKVTDVVGLAALLAAAGMAECRGATLSVRSSPAIYRALLEAELLGEIPLLGDAPLEAAFVATPPERATAPTYVARTRRLGLRQPTWEELGLFARWAREPLLDQMVGSELLYRCRHLGPYHPDFAAFVLADPVSVTLVVEPLDPPHAPVGFVRLYDVHLAQQFAFLETALADLHFIRRGWGVDATRLFLAFGCDVLGLQRVEAKVYAYNVLSSNSLKRGGFHLDGVLRQARVYNGERWDINVFSILAEEMREQRRKEQFPYMGFWERADVAP